MLTGQLLPTSGTAKVAGYDVVSERQQLKPRIGVVFDNQNIYQRMSARENLVFYARLYRIPKIRVEEILAQVGLTERANDKVQHYSNGMKQRVLIARVCSTSLISYSWMNPRAAWTRTLPATSAVSSPVWRKAA